MSKNRVRMGYASIEDAAAHAIESGAKVMFEFDEAGVAGPKGNLTLFAHYPDPPTTYYLTNMIKRYEGGYTWVKLAEPYANPEDNAED